MPYIGKSPLTGNYNKLDSITGSFNGSTTAFNLTVGSNALTPVRAETLLVSLNGVIQQAATDYTVSGTQITFTTAPASSDTCFIIAFGEKLDIGTPSDATVTSAKLASTVLTGATDIGAGIADADLFLVDDGAGGTLRKTAASRIKTYAGTDLTAIADGSVGSPSLANSGDTNTGIYFPAADTVGVVTGGTEQFRFGSNPIPGGSKNLVINGGMNVAQRGTQTEQYSGYTVDQFWFQEGGSIQARFTTTQDGSGGGGHANSLKLDTTTAESTIASGDLLNLQHRIEAQNLQHLQWGSASAKDVTLSFWMSSPKTGTHCVSLYQPDATRSYISEFTIASANTFEYFSVTIPGDTSGTINDDTGAGLYVSFPILSGTTYQAAAGSWLASQDYATSNQQNLADSDANNIFITGVQLEVGSVATDFAHEDIGTTLRKCWRYYQHFGPLPAGEFDIQGAYAWKANTADGLNSVYIMVDLDAKARMRGTPTFTTSGVGATNWKIYTGTRSLDVITVMSGAGLANATTSGLVSIYIVATGTDFTVGSPVFLVSGTSGSTFYYFSAEL